MAITRPQVHDVSLRQLEYVVAVADSLGFRRAAERCAVSQPALSAQIAQVESLLGVTLFERDRRTVRITPAGTDVVARARRILTDVGDLLESAQRGADPLAGTFRVGVIPTIAPYFLPEVVRVVSQKFPRIRLLFREAKTEDTVRDLWAGSLDVGLVALEADLGKLHSAPVLAESFVVAMARQHPLARMKRLTLENLRDRPVLLLDDGHCLRTQVLALCTQSAARETDFRATSLATLVQMVAVSDAVTLLPAFAVPVENRGDQLAIRRLDKPEPFRTLALVWRPRSPLEPTFAALATALREELDGKKQAAGTSRGTLVKHRPQGERKR